MKQFQGQNDLPYWAKTKTSFYPPLAKGKNELLHNLMVFLRNNELGRVASALGLSTGQSFTEQAGQLSLKSCFH